MVDVSLTTFTGLAGMSLSGDLKGLGDQGGVSFWMAPPERLQHGVHLVHGSVHLPTPRKKSGDRCHRLSIAGRSQILRLPSQKEKRASTGFEPNLSRPARKGSSIRTARATISAPKADAKRHVAAAVPPVAKTSSTMRTLCPG